MKLKNLPPPPPTTVTARARAAPRCVVSLSGGLIQFRCVALTADSAVTTSAASDVTPGRHALCTVPLVRNTAAARAGCRRSFDSRTSERS